MIFDDLANLARSANAIAESWYNPPIRLGVTGLARSGKTVFITALVHNLIHGGRLPFFRAAAEGRILRAYLEPQPDDSVPRFAYEDHIAHLTHQPPEWPESTRQISQLRLTLEYEPASFLRRQFGTSRVHIDIVDYPGEWLLDLPLLQLSYEEWSAEALALSRMPERCTHAAEWHQFLSGVNNATLADEQVAINGAKLFGAYLKACRNEKTLLASLTPGRMLMPGDLDGSPALTFMPLDIAPQVQARRDSLHAMMARRFEAYKTYVIKPFFRDHFVKLERQIVLVDALGAVNAGAAAVADLERTLAAVLNCFRPGGNNWLSSILGKRIDRILFAATKADHIHHTNHDKLEAILRQLVQKAIVRAEFSGARVEAAALAAVRSTREMAAKEGGEALACIAGVPLAGESLDGQSFDGREEIALFPGDLNAEAGRSESAGATVQFVRFAPPALVSRSPGTQPLLPHIRLDRAIEFLIGDKFP